MNTTVAVRNPHLVHSVRPNAKNNRLEFIRGVAAILVFICHLIVMKPALHNIDGGLVSHWGTESVMLFFVLSGVVIAMSHENSPAGLGKFMARRVARIFPLLVISLLLAYAMIAAAGKEELKMADVVGNLLLLATLDGKLFPVPITNISVWSLSFEMFFYLVFGMLVVKGSYRWLWGWWVVSVAAIPFYYKDYPGFVGYVIAHLAFSIPWLIGVMIYRRRHALGVFSFSEAAFYAGLLPGIARLNFSGDVYCVVKYIMFAIGTVPVFAYALQSRELQAPAARSKWIMGILWYLLVAILIYGRSEARPHAKMAYLAVPLLALLTGGLIAGWCGKAERVIGMVSGLIGGISYGIYIIHFPVLTIMERIIQKPWLYVVAGTIVTFAVAFILERQVQPRLARVILRRRAAL